MGMLVFMYDNHVDLYDDKMNFVQYISKNNLQFVDYYAVDGIFVSDKSKFYEIRSNGHEYEFGEVTWATPSISNL